MTLKICENIAKYRKERNITQTELAEYLGVSPQAVSKWEQQISIPDVYLIPQIAVFFQVSIDTLFGNSNLDTIKLLVSKYAERYNDADYREAKTSIEMLLEAEPENVEILECLCKLEYHRAMEYLDRSRNVCKKIKELSEEKDESLEHRTEVQLMRFRFMLGEPGLMKEYTERFEKSKAALDFNYLLITLCGYQRYAEALQLGEQYIDTFTSDEQQQIYPNLMEAAYQSNDIAKVEECFASITNGAAEKEQIFNAWWLLWKTYLKNHRKEADACKEEVIRQLPIQGFNAYELEKVKMHLEGTDGQLINIL